MTRLLGLLAGVAAWACLAASSGAAVISYDANLTGDGESNSLGTGFTQVDYDDANHTLHVFVSFSGLGGNTTASHIHAPTAVAGTGTAGVATTTPTFAGFPLGVTSGAYDHTLDLTQASSWNPTYVTNNGGTTASAEAALASSLAADKAYLNIHTNLFAGGEIRGFLTPVPEPACLGLLALGGLAILRRRK
jgi:hypothetical protein